MTVKLTKQGVRDLNHLKGLSVGRKLEEPPVPVACKHRNTRTIGYPYEWIRCEDCGASWEPEVY